MTTVYEQVVLADSPLRFYPCNDGSSPLADISGNSQNATVSGSPTYGVAGLLTSESSTAIQNTSTSYATIPNAGLPTGNSPITLEVWTKCLARVGNFKGIFSVGSQVAGESFNLGYNTSNDLYGELKGTSINGPLTVLNAIYHLVLTWDGTTLTFYVNGVSQGTATPGAASLTYGGAVLDAFSDTTSRPGWTDQYAAIYGAALSQGRVTAHYNAGHYLQGAASFTANAAISASARMQSKAAVQANATVAATPARISTSAKVVSNASLVAKARITASATVQANAKVSASARVQSSAAFQANALLTSHARIDALAAFMSNATLIGDGQVIIPYRRLTATTARRATLAGSTIRRTPLIGATVRRSD